MRFFTDMVDRKHAAIGITGLLSNITTREGSHKGGWARLLKCQLENAGYFSVKILDNHDSLENYEVIIFDLGAEFSGALNMFGGLDQKAHNRLTQILKFGTDGGEFFSWKHDLPNIEKALQGRRTNDSTCQAFKSQPPEFVMWVQGVLNACRTFDHVYKTENVLIGDSHTPSVWTPEFMIERQDGRTLYGATRDQTITHILSKLGPVKTVQVHMSSIDIRHHIYRQLDPWISLYDMINLLGNELTFLKNKGVIENVVLTQTMGIEDESRELPKTGYYKGTPFFGSWHDRNELRKYFNDKLDEMAYLNNWSVLKFPSYFFDESGKLRFEVMERPQSVHLSPEHYRWNLNNNFDRWKLAEFSRSIAKDVYGS